MASRARQITALVSKQGNAIAQRSYHASSSQMAGMSPPLPPFTRIPRESGSVRYRLIRVSRNLEFMFSVVIWVMMD
jgi:hypothetical protein